MQGAYSLERECDDEEMKHLALNTKENECFERKVFVGYILYTKRLFFHS